MKRLLKSAALCSLLFSSMVTAMPTENHFFDQIEGVYKVRFKNALANGEAYQSENILEILPIDQHAAYVRMKLEFANGHVGDISGIATQEDHALVYKNIQSNCVVKWVWGKENVVSHADYEQHPGCDEFHGIRGTLNNMIFPIKNKREIRYVKIIRNSEQFKNAMNEYQTKK